MRQSDGSVLWCVWAPKHSVVHLVLGSGNKTRELSMTRESDGYWVHQATGIVDGTRYGYRLGSDSIVLPDPASRWQPDGVHKPSAVFSPQGFAWTDQAWRGVSLRDLAIYELHVGTFTPDGTFEAIIPRLPDLVDLGITAIELMPIAQFPGDRNWGYDGVHSYAAQNTYGGPLGLQRLVDAAHRAGLAVLLDVVYNHLGPEGNYFGQFGPYFTERHHTPWGAALNYDDADSDPVRQFVVENACAWIRDFHLDGLRLDAVQTILDLGAHHLLAELQAAVQKTAQHAGRTAVVIAETDQNDPRVVTPVEQGGYGLDAMWSDDFHHSLHALLTGERGGYYVDFGTVAELAKSFNDVYVADGCYNQYRRRRHGAPVGALPRERFLAYIQNHDHVGNRAAGDRMYELIAPEAQRLAAALVLLSPFTPLLFMGEEYAESRRFPFFCSFFDPRLVEAVRDGRRRAYAELANHWGENVPDPFAVDTFTGAKLSWAWPEGTSHGKMRRLYRQLLHARRHEQRQRPVAVRTAGLGAFSDQRPTLIWPTTRRCKPIMRSGS